VKRLSVRLLLTDEQAARACKTLDVHPTELDGAALVRSGIVKLGSDCVLVGTVEDIPGRLGIEIDGPNVNRQTLWFDDETAQKRAALEALQRFERVRYVRETASAFDWPFRDPPDSTILEWARGAAQEIHANHTNYSHDKDGLDCEIGECSVTDCIEACRVLGITGGES
jgi:hypothetical protein